MKLNTFLKTPHQYIFFTFLHLALAIKPQSSSVAKSHKELKLAKVSKRFGLVPARWLYFIWTCCHMIRGEIHL